MYLNVGKVNNNLGDVYILVALRYNIDYGMLLYMQSSSSVSDYVW